MSLRIDNKNIDQWCFDYLEKLLPSDEVKFFEQELETNKVLKQEFAKWKNTVNKDLSSIPVNPELEESILNVNKGFPYLKVLAPILVGVLLVILLVFLFNTKSETDMEDEILPVSNSELEKLEPIQKEEVKLEDSTVTKDTLPAAVEIPKKDSVPVKTPIPIKSVPKKEPIKTTPPKIKKVAADTIAKKEAVKVIDTNVEPVIVEEMPVSVKEADPIPVETSTSEEEKKEDKILKRILNK